MASFAATVPAAIEQALALFEPEERPANVRLRDGYLDLLGDNDRRKPHFGQRVLQSRLVPPLYNLLHPLAMRVEGGRRAPGLREEQRIALEMLELTDDDRVLDVACGPGNFTRNFAAATGDGLVVGLDLSKAMLAAATHRTRSGNVAYIRGDACAATPFQGSSFDAVSCFGAMHLFEQPMRALDEFVRVLAPGGRVALMTSCEYKRSAPRDGLAARRFGGWLMFRRDELTEALDDHGLVDIEQRVMRALQFVSARKPAG